MKEKIKRQGKDGETIKFRMDRFSYGSERFYWVKSKHKNRKTNAKLRKQRSNIRRKEVEVI